MSLSLRSFTRLELRALSLLLLLLGASLLAQAQTIRYVRTDATNTNPATATTWATSTTNLQGAINASAAGDQVWVAQGTYKPGGNANTDRTISFAMKNGVSILGGFAATGDPTLTARNPTSFTTVLSGDIGTVGGNADNSYHVVSNPKGLNASAVLDGVVIRNGNADGSGGDKDSGGGMLNAGSSPTLISCSFVSNSANLNGGGLCNNGDSTPTLTNCSFQGNRGAYGGGMCNYFPGSSPTLTNCSFVSNSADFYGGGVCSIYYNTTTLINCSFVGNSTRNNGAGVANRNGSNSRLVNCVLFGNGGANALFKESDCRITVTYSLLEAGVTAYTDEGNNLTTPANPFTSTASTQLNACAPAINTGNNAANSTTTDLAGNPRIANTTIDMGAYEYQAAPGIALTAPGVSTATVGVAFSQSFTASGGTSPYSYSVASGTLPPGLNLATTGVLSGTPTQSGSFTITVRGQDATGCSGVSAAYALTVSVPPSPIRYVRAGAMGSGNSWADASGDLQSQINVTGAQQVWVAQGTYKPNPSSSFAMKNGVAIYGGFADTETPTSLTERNPDSFTTVLSGDNKVQVFVNSGGLTATAVLDGVTITRGYVVYGWGGGMHNANGSSPTLANCIFLNNSASFGGGGMYNNGSSPTLTNCLFLGNKGGGQGGGIHNTRSNPTLTNCRFMTNSANGGGGIYNTQQSTPILTSCLFQNNSADGLGGGVANLEGGNPQLLNCSFINNSATRGGGITHFYGKSSLVNCLFQGNTASEGGAVYNNGASDYVRLFNCTLVNNSAPSGGGTYTSGYNVNTILTSCVVFGNGGANTFVNASEDPYGGTKISYSLLETGSMDFIDEGNNLMTAVSPFVSSTDVRLNGCSSAINAGRDGNNNSTTDLAGDPRRYNGGIIDMGAFEYQGQPNLPTAITQQPPSGSLVCPGSAVSIPLSVSGTGAFIYQLVDANGTPVGPSQSTTPLTLANVQPAQSGSYSVIVTGSCNSVTSTAFSLTVNAPPGATLTANPSAVLSCAQTSLTLTAGGGDTYTFSGPGMVSQDDNQAVVNAPGTYSVTVTKAGCTSSTTIAISQDNSQPTVSIDPTTATLTCTVPIVTLTANTAVSSLTWSTGQTTPSISVSVAGTYSVTAMSSNGCLAMAQATVSGTTDAPTPPMLSASPATTTTNQPITVTASGCSGGIINWTALGGSGQASGTTYTVSQPGNYTLSSTCTLNGCTSVASASLSVQIRPGGFAITGVSPVSCQLLDAGRGQYEIRFTPQYADAAGPVSFSIVNELSPTTAPGPYTLRLYSDNPLITLVATQSGSPEARFVYNWLAACSVGTPPNRPPVARPIPDQTLPQGQAYSLALTDYITDPDGQPLTFSASGLPADLSLSVNRISGTVTTTGVSTISVTALDPAGLQVTTRFQLTVTPIISTPAGFTIVGVTTVSCQTLSTGQRQVRFLPQYGGINGQPITFQVTNELAPTQQAGPYTLNLYTDNPVIGLQATQAGSATPATFRYDWLPACSSGTPPPTPDNRAPVVSSGVRNQTATVGQGYTLFIPVGTFTDPDGDALSLRATGLPAGLTFSGSTLTGTPAQAGVSTVSLTARDSAGLSASLTFTLTVVSAATTPPGDDFAIVGVTPGNCAVISAGQRQISFTPQYSGVSGSPISFSVVNELSPTTAPGPYSLLLYTDNPVITLKAQQGAALTSFSYNWLAACSASGRQGTAEVSSPLRVTVLGNPVQGQQVVVEIRGGGGQPVQLTLVDMQGKWVHTQRIDQAGDVERVSLPLGTSHGVLVLHVSTPTQYQAIKLLQTN